jgi:hypothetical protein
MKQLRQAILWAVLAAIFLLMALSAIGALLGAEKARELFNSVPMIVYWFLSLLLLAAGFASFRRLIAAPAGLAMHLGALLIIGGAMWGSETGHQWRTAWFGVQKAQSGMMHIAEGEADDAIRDERGEPIVKLPFSLHLKDFRIEYWPAKETQWSLVVVAPVMDAEGHLMARQQQSVGWKPGEDIPLPLTNVHLKVLQYLPHARPTFAAGAKPHMAITDAAGKMLGDLPPEAGAEVAFKEPAVTVKITRVFQNFKIMGGGPQRQIIDAVGQGENPALQVLVSRGAETVWEGYVFPQMPGQVEPTPGASPLILQYAMPGPTGAAEDPASPSPAMELLLTHGSRQERQWIMPEPGADMAQLPLAPLVAGGPEAHGMGRMMAPELYLVQPRGSVKSYQSDVTILEDNRKVGEAVIEVNHPLHWGGYSFYQSSYDAERESYTVLSVVSDSGLAVVYLGMAVLSIGAFWRFWGEAAWGWTRKQC